MLELSVAPSFPLRATAERGNPGLPEQYPPGRGAHAFNDWKGHVAYKPRASRKGLTADGSTRSWRRAREAIPGPKRCHVCGTTKNLQADHVRPRRSGGTDAVSNLRWVCVKHQNSGRPKGS